MKKKAYFIPNKTDAPEWATCDKCGELIKNIPPGRGYWNPNKNAQDKDICQNCYEVWKAKRDEGFRRWKDAHENLQGPK